MNDEHIEYEERGSFKPFKITLNKTETPSDSENDVINERQNSTPVKKIVLPKVMVKLYNEQKLISPTKESYLTCRTNLQPSICDEKLLLIKNNVPMYLFDMN